MKPKGQTEHDTGMLEFLEDIIGTSRFKVSCYMRCLYLPLYLFFKVQEVNARLIVKIFVKSDIECNRACFIAGRSFFKN